MKGLPREQVIELDEAHVWHPYSVCRLRLHRGRHQNPLAGYVRPLGNVVYIAPSLNIADSNLDELLTIVADSVRAVTTSS